MKIPAEQLVIADYLQNLILHEFIFRNLKQSLADIGFSERLIGDLLDSLSGLPEAPFDVDSFGAKHEEELNRVYSKGFFQRYVPDYFSKYVVPSTPACRKIIDVGCGTGILAKLYSQSEKWQEIVGIDIDPYPEWDQFKNDKISYEVVKEKDFVAFLKKEKPDSVAITWTLHHMEFEEQERYMRYLFDALKPGSWVVVLEDSYTTDMKPENGVELWTPFMNLSADDRGKAMSVYDWIANRVLAQRTKVPIPFGYRTVEDWEKMFKSVGFRCHLKRFIGFPEKRDINTPQSLIVLQR